MQFLCFCFLILLRQKVQAAADMLEEEHWVNFNWKKDDVLDRIDKKFEDDFLRSYAEYNYRNQMDEARRNAVEYRYDILDTIRAKNRYTFLSDIEKHLLTSNKIRIVPDEELNGNWEKDNNRKWEEILRDHEVSAKMKESKFSADDFPSEIDLDKSYPPPIKEPIPNEIHLFEDNFPDTADVIYPYTGDLSEFEEVTVTLDDFNH